MSEKKKLEYWQDWISRNESAYADELKKMDRREALYRGEIREISPMTAKDRMKDGNFRKTVHLRNIVAENIESEVSSTIPQPKVTAKRQSDEWRAKILEDMLRNELDRLPMETLNDQMERTVPIQGGGFWLVEWDNSRKTRSTVGDVTVSILHPKQVIPQDGVFGSVEDMDAIALKLPQTRAWIKRTYGKDIDGGEDEPEARTLDEDADTAEDMVTQYVVYYRNDDGGVGKFSWAGDTVLEDLEDFEARQVRRCENCGEIVSAGETRCPACGGKVREQVETEETVYRAVQTRGGTEIPGDGYLMDEQGKTVLDENGQARTTGPSRLPYYKPDVFPVFLQRNVSLFGRLLGDSDADKIEDQQNSVNRLETKIIDRLIKAGTRITLPDRADLRTDPEDAERWYVGSAADANSIKLLQFSGDLQYEFSALQQYYEESRQILGITDSFQGRQDATAQSGVAKQFAAAQSAGRLESKRVMKEAAYAELFRRIVMLKVAYADEPRPVVATDDRGAAQYEEFNRYDFYEPDENGEWHCILEDDRFLFSCDISTTLASNRERMWQDAAQMFQMGAFGPPQSLDALLLYWTKLELLHYPGAGDTKEYLEKLQAQQQQAAIDAQAKQDAMAEIERQRAAMEQEQRDRAEREDKDRQTRLEIDRQAREDARRDALAMNGQQARGF